MVWIYLIVGAVGLRIIAWCFKVEDKVTYATAFGIGAGFSLLFGVLASPIPGMFCMALLMLLFSRMDLASIGGQETILSLTSRSFQELIALCSAGRNPVSRLMLKPLSRFLTYLGFHLQQAQRTNNVTYSNYSSDIIDVKAVEVTIHLSSLD